MAGEQDHSLLMEIEADFGSSIDSAAQFEQSIKGLNDLMTSLSNNVNNIAKSRNSVEDGLREQITNVYGQIREGTFQLDGKNITDAITKRIAEAVSGRGIQIKDLAESDKPLEIDLPSEQADAIQKQFAEAIAASANKFKISGVANKPINIAINADQMMLVQNNLKTALLRALEKNIKFETPKGEKLELLMANDDYQMLLNQVRSNFYKLLNNPKVVQVSEKEIKPITVKSDVLDKVIADIEKAVGAIDVHFEESVLGKLNDLPNVKDKIKDFQKHTLSLFTELEETISAIDQLNPENKNYTQLRYHAARMRNMIISSGTDIIKQATEILEQTLNINTPGDKQKLDVSELVNSVGAIKSYLSQHVSKLAAEANEAVYKELQLARTNINGVDTFVPTMQKMQENIAAAASQALKNLSGANLKIDTKQIEQIFSAWSVATSQQLMANSVKSLTDLQTSLLVSNEKVLSSYAKSMQKLMKLKFNTTEADTQPINIEVNTKNIRKDLKEHLTEIATSITSTVNFTSGAKDTLDQGITLNKKQTAAIQNNIASILENQLKQLSGEISDRTGKGFDNAILEKFDKAVFNEAKNLVGSMVDQANLISKAITEGMGSANFKMLDVSEQKAIEERFKQAGDKLVKDFSTLMDNALGSFVITSQITEEVKDNFRREIGNLATQATISFDDANTPVILHGIVADIQRKLQNTVKMNVEAWQPDLLKFEPNINFKSVFDNINHAINGHLNTVGDELLKTVEQQYNPINKRSQEKFVKHQKNNDGEQSVLTRKRIMGEELKRLKAQGFAFNNKSEKGYEYTLQDRSKFSEDELAKLVAELNAKFNAIADGKAKQVREVNIELSKQKIVTALAPIRGSIFTYLATYVQAVGNVINEISPNVDNEKVNVALGKKIKSTVEKVCSGTEKTIERRIDSLNTAMSSVLKSIQGEIGTIELPNLNGLIKTKELHTEVKKLFAKQHDMLVKDFEKANPTFEGPDAINLVLEKNVQAIMDKFHDTVTKQTTQSISAYLNELDKLKAAPRTDSVNHIALALNKIQSAFEDKIRSFIEAQAYEIAQVIGGHGFNKPSIGANVGKLINNAAVPLNYGAVPTPVNYGQGLEFPDFEDDDTIPKAPPKAIGFHQSPENSDWLANIQEQADQDWSMINSWVNSRILDGINAKTAVKGRIPSDLEAHLNDYIDNHFIPSVKSVATTPYDPADKDAGSRVREEMARIIQDFKLATTWVKKLIADGKTSDAKESFELQRSAIETRIDNLKESKGLQENDFTHLKELLGAAVSSNDLKTVLQEVGGYGELYKAMGNEESFELKQNGLHQLVNSMRGSSYIPEYEIDKLSDSINEAETANDLKRVRLELTAIRDLYRSMAKAETFTIQQDVLRHQADSIRNGVVVPENELNNVSQLIDGAKTANDLKRVRLELQRIRALQRQMVKDKRAQERAEEEERKKGSLIGQSDALKTNKVIQAEILQHVLKQIPAMQSYNVQQLKVNNATNSWSAKLQDAVGNIKSVQGTVDKATGSLYQHSEALSQVISQVAKLASVSGPKYGGQVSQPKYYANQMSGGNAKSYNPNGDFSSSVYNTMRYMTAGAVMGVPSMLLWDAWESNKDFEYQMERARQNFVIKGSLEDDKLMEEATVNRIKLQNPDLKIYKDESDEITEEALPLYKAEQQKMLGLAGHKSDVATTKVQNLAIKYRVDTQEAAKAFHISSRLLDDPNDAYAMTEAVVKANSIEEMDIEEGTKGMEAVSSQWGLKGGDYEKVIDKMIIAANLTPATVEDLLATQQRSGSIFKDALPGMTKDEAISTSIALSSMFNQATARSGAEGGTFFKTILQSPFTKKGAKTLQNISLQEGFEDLNPYNEDGSQKDFVTLFSKIMEKSLTLPDQDKKELWANIFPQWHQGSAAAIESFMNDSTKDLQKILEDIQGSNAEEADTDGDGQISFDEAFKYFINRVSEPDDGAIDEMLRGNASTWKQQLQLLASTFQAATYNVFTELKDEFGMLVHYLQVYMRLMRDNASEFAAIASTLTKIGTGYAMGYGVNKVVGFMKDKNEQRKVKRFEQVGDYLFEERRAENLKKTAIEDQLKGNGLKQAKIDAEKQSVQARLNELRPEYATKKSLKDSKEKDTQKLVERQQNGEDVSVELGKARAEFSAMESDAMRLRLEIARLDNELSMLDQTDQRLADNTEHLNREFNKQVQQINDVSNRMDALADAMDDVGLDSKKIRKEVEKLDQEFKSGATDIAGYEKSLTDLAADSGLSEKNLQKLRTAVDILNEKFKQGEISVEAYARSIKELEKAHKLGNANINGGGVDGAGTQAQSGFGLMEMIVAGSLLTGGIGSKRGIFQRIKDWKTTGSIKTAFGRGRKMTDNDGNVLYEQNRDGTQSTRPIYEADVLSQDRKQSTQTKKDDEKWYKKGILGKVGGVAGKIGDSRAGSLLKMAGKGTLYGAIATAGTQVFDLVTQATSQDFEQTEAKAKKLENLARDAESLSQGKFFEKTIAGFNLLSDITVGGLNNLLGGSEASYGQAWSAIKKGFNGNEKTEEELLAEFNIKGLREKAAKQEEAYREKTDPSYESLESALDDQTDVISEAEQEIINMTEALNELNTTMNRQLSILDADKTIDETKLLLSGVSEDSQQMRDLQTKHLNERNIVLQEALSDLESKMTSFSDKDSETYKDMELQKKQIEAQMASNNYEKYATGMSEYDQIMKRLSDQLDQTEDEYGIQENQAKLSGASDDSPVLKKIEAAKVGDSNNSIEKAQSELQALVTRLNLNENSADYMKIQNTIKDLEKQQLDNLVAIKSNLDKSQGTFNLPSGVKVTDYMSHMMSGNTHKNVTTRTGDTVVNVTISNMSGDTKDVKNMTDSVASAVKQANQQSVSNFNKQVWSGMGSSYTSPY